VKVRLLGSLVAVAMLAACGGGDDDASDQAADLPTPAPTVTVAARPNASPTAAATPPSPLPIPNATLSVKVPTTKATTPPKLPAYRIAMPDGRTAPNTTTDWKFENFAVEQKNQQRSGTVDVTYLGPGLASMEFTVLVTQTGTGPFGELRSTFELRGFISAIQADATETVRLLGGGESDIFAQDATYEPSFSITKVTDDDPKARPN
jgi:hypothetical protein